MPYSYDGPVVRLWLKHAYLVNRIVYVLSLSL